MANEILTASEIAAIEEHRLTRRWSYRELAEDLSARTGIPMPEVTLYKALSEPRRPLRKTTVFPIRKYVALIGDRASRREVIR